MDTSINNSATSKFRKRKIRLLLALPTYKCGGAERVITTLAKFINRELFDVHIVTLNESGPFKEVLPANIHCHNLECRRVAFALWKFVSLVRTLKPDVLLTTVTHLNAAVGLIKKLFPKNTRVIARETGVLEESLKSWNTTILFEKLIAFAYRQHDIVIGQSDFAIQELSTRFQIPLKKLVKVGNPIDEKKFTQDLRNKTNCPFVCSLGSSPDSAKTRNTRNVLAVGRLVAEKNYQQIIFALKDTLSQKNNVHLWIIGEGPELSNLKALGQKLSLSANLHFPGFRSDIEIWMSHADLFVMSSVSESLPNTLLEAIACGCPIVSTIHIGGTKEVLTRVGLLNRWVVSLSPWKDEWFERPDCEVREKLLDEFNQKKIVSQYEQLFQSIILEK